MRSAPGVASVASSIVASEKCGMLQRLTHAEASGEVAQWERRRGACDGLGGAGVCVAAADAVSAATTVGLWRFTKRTRGADASATRR